MADTKRSSQIPVMTPRSSSLSSPIGLVPPSRYPSVSGSPTIPTPAASPSPSSGSTPFRSFRNFLSFGGSKHGSSSSASALPKSAFTSLGPVRRSVNVERRVSSPNLNPSRRSEDEYVLSIDLPRPGGEKSPHTLRPQKSNTGPNTPKTPSSQLSRSSRSESPTSDTQAALGVTELSTIIESETSGISKHLPSLDTSQASHGAESESDAEHQSPRGFLPLELQHLRPPRNDIRLGSSSSSNDTSPLDLSTSGLTHEVFAALSASPGKQDWLHDIVVDDTTSDSPISRERTPENPDASFHMDVLDSDLAALLSPNRMRDTEPALLVAIDAMPPPAPTSSPPSPTALLPARTPLEKPAVTPARRLPPASLSAAPRRPTTSTLPRIVRSASDRPAFPIAGTSGIPSPTSRTPSGRAMSHSPERPASMGSATSSQRHTHSQRTNSVDVRRPNTGNSGSTMENRTPAALRLMTPARLATLSPSSSASGSRPPLSRFNSAQSSGIWDSESVSPSSRPPSSIGTAPSRLQEHRPSLDIDRPRPMGTRTRKRSSSVIEHRVTPSTPSYSGSGSPASRATDWLGPRTQKAFAAAGLLDFDKESPRSASRPASRFGTTRSSVERERSRYAPSRMAFSEAGSSSSWGARSLSRATGYGEIVGGPSSESMSTPRTTFSASSTAPTSISASSSNQHMHSEIQALQERHALESGALLNALADSQRTTKMLREENAQLRERLQFLEDKLAGAEDRIQQLQYSQPPPPTSTSRSHYNRRFASPALTDNRTLPTHSRRGSFLRAQPEPYADLHSSPDSSSHSPEMPREHSETFTHSHRKRTSIASSVFAPVPNNMSMIMQEDGVTPESSVGGLSMNSSLHSSPPGSPTMVLGRVQPPPITTKASPRGPLNHAANKSISSSAGNISPTTANFSMLSGSPGSLNLRPEHELHLGDMPNLDLAGDGLEDWGEDGDQ
ncbi:hypothetical protein C2E23DRAFT_885245 [Lenzites betulinus]|nr:hypothetical protein C2E23DRAFT_885245 [Lenzites betulinus]